MAIALGLVLFVFSLSALALSVFVWHKQGIQQVKTEVSMAQAEYTLSEADRDVRKTISENHREFVSTLDSVKKDLLSITERIDAMTKKKPDEPQEKGKSASQMRSGSGSWSDQKYSAMIGDMAHGSPSAEGRD